jgi:uncharacterized protein
MAEKEEKQVTVEDKLKALFELQQVDSKFDKIVVLRGELPLEVSDLEDEIIGLETRISKIKEELKSKEAQISGKNIEIADSETLIKRYTEQQEQVRNNREFDSLSKEIEFQQLEIELSSKRIREFTIESDTLKNQLETLQASYDGRKADLDHKRAELDDIVAETQKEEEELTAKSQELQAFIEPRLLMAYKRIRTNARNGLAVVNIERDSCGGCFNKIPPQRQLDIMSHKKVIVCEYCGRILVDSSFSYIDHEVYN